MMTVLDRSMQTEGIEIQLLVIRILNQAIISFPDSYFVDSDVPHQGKRIIGSDCEAKLYKLFKVLFNVFLYYVPGFVDNAASACNSFISYFSVLSS